MGNVVEEVLVPASQGRGVLVKEGQLLDIVDVEGQQVGDIVARLQHDPTEYMSPAHTVSCNASIKLGTGSQLFSNRRNPVFTIVATTSRSMTSSFRVVTTNAFCGTTDWPITSIVLAISNRPATFSAWTTTFTVNMPGTCSCTTA